MGWLRPRTMTIAVLAGLALVPAGRATSQAAAAPAGQAALPPDPVIEMREHWLDAPISAFNFRHSADMFEVRPVHRAGPVTPLVRGPALSPPSYEFEGQRYDYAQFARRTYTNAIIVLRDGKVVFEDYRNNTRPDDRFISFSMAKSITSLLVGLAVERGAIAAITDPVAKYVPELANGAYGKATIRDLLRMRSGVAYEERYDFGDKPSLAALIHRNAIVLNRERFADRAVGIGAAAAPGTRFNYATLDTAVLGLVVERATGQSLAAWMQRTLWQPAGMEADGLWIADGPPGVGRELAGMGFNARLRDYARLGQLLLDQGKVRGRQVVPAAWIREAITMQRFDKPATLGGVGYGYQFWQLDDEPGAFVALGLAGQFIYVHPASRTVIVKLSHFPLPEPANVMPETLAWFHAVVRTPVAGKTPAGQP